MPDIYSGKRHFKFPRKHVPTWDQDPQRTAQSMIQIFGAAAASKAIEMVRMQTNAGDRDAALKWHHVMRLIEEARQKPR
jgi:hypothetical protein